MMIWMIDDMDKLCVAVDAKHATTLSISISTATHSLSRYELRNIISCGYSPCALPIAIDGDVKTSRISSF